MVRFSSFSAFVCVLLLFCSGALSGFATSHIDPATLTGGPCDPPSAPTSFTVTSATTTSISLAWSAPTAPVFTISTDDLTDPMAVIPDVNGSGNTATVSGLQPGHDYEFSLRVAYSSGCPWSAPVKEQGRTSIIIIDVVAGLTSPCTPGSLNSANKGDKIVLCVEKYENYTDIGIIKYVFGTDVGYLKVKYDAIETTGGIRIGRISNAGYTTPNEITISQQEDGGGIVASGSQVLTVRAGAINEEYAEVELEFGKNGSCSYCRLNLCSSSSRPARDNGFSPVPVDPPQVRPTGGEPVLAPNPFANTTTLHYQLAQTTVVQIQVFDAMGRLVQTPQPTATLPEGPQTAVVDGAGLPNGVYFVVLQTDGQRQVQRLVKQD